MIAHLVMNETEAVMLSECKPDDIVNQTGWTSVAEYFLKLGVKNVVVTLGEKGAYYENESGSGHVEAEKNCTILDTSGAGCVPRHPRRFRYRVRVFSLADTDTGATGIALWVHTQRNTWHRSRRADGTLGLQYSMDAKRQHVLSSI